MRSFTFDGPGQFLSLAMGCFSASHLNMLVSKATTMQAPKGAQPLN
jgi:hypothetical protein